MKTKVVIIGYGTMGKAITAALRRHSGVSVFGARRQTSGARAKKEISSSDFVILAVKPQDAPAALSQFGKYLNKKAILISIMAGVPLKKLTSMAGHKKVIRLMPNLGLLVGEGIAVWKGAGMSSGESARAAKFIDKITANFEVKSEDTINRVTAISGSGPAYFFLLANSLMKASASFGLTADESRKLVEKTFTAAAILSKGADYGELIKKVASKKGTTEAALKVFKKENFEKIVRNAVNAGYKRAKELSK